MTQTTRQFANTLLRFTLWIWVLCFWHGRTSGQQSIWRHYGALTEQKWLPNYAIKDIFQDRDGRIWVATSAGLYKHNINNTAHYDITRYTKDKYLNNELFSICGLSDRSILVGTQSGIGRFLVDSNTISLVGNRDQVVNQIIQSGNDAILYITDHRNVYHLKLASDGQSYQGEAILKRGPQANLRVKTVATLANGQYLIGGADGLWILGHGTLHATPIKGSVTALYTEGDTAWIGTAFDGIYRCTVVAGGFATVGRHIPKDSAGKIESIQEIKAFNHEGLLFATTKRLFFVQKENFPASGSIQRKTLFEQHAIHRIFVDNTKTVWIGSRNGLFTLSPQRLLTRFASFDNGPYQQEAVNDMLWLTEDSLLLANSSGIARLDTRSHQITPLKTPFREVKLLRKTKNGRLLVVANNRVYQTDVHRLHQPVDTGRKIAMRGVNDVVEIGDGEYWFSHWRQKIIRMHDGPPDAKLDPVYEQIIRSFSSNVHIYVLEIDSKNNLWVGTRGEGLLRINLTNHSIKKFSRNDHFPDQILSIKEDSRGRLWVGSRDKGLLLYRPETDDFQLFDHRYGLPSNTVCAIQESADGKLWLSTLNGIARLSEGRIWSFRAYNKESGIFNAEFSFNVTARGSNNTVYFGSANGIYQFAGLPKSYQEVPLAWTNIDLIDGNKQQAKRTSSDNFSTKMLQKVEESGAIVLQHHQNSLQIGFAKLDYAVPEQHIYMYRLLGYDTTWTVKQGGNSVVRYVNLPPRDYVFQVMTTDSDDSWQHSPKSITLTIKPAFWQTDLAHVLYALVLGGLILACYKIVLRWKSINRKLKAEMESVKLFDRKMVHYTDLSHEIKNRLTLMLGPLEDALKNKKVNFQMLTRLYDQGQRLERLSDQIMDIRKSGSGDFLLTVEEEDISALVSKIVEDARPLALVKDINIMFETADQHVAGWCDAEIVEIIITNILNNAIKYCRPGDTVKVALDVQYGADDERFDAMVVRGDYLVCMVSDTGIGIPEADILKVTQPYYRSQEKQLRKEISGKGIGLDLVARLVKKHRGHFEIKSRQNEFTTVAFYLPIDKLAFTAQERRPDLKSQPIVIAERNLKETSELIFPDVPYKKRIVKQLPGKEFKLLIVDDDPDLLAYLEELLSADFTVYTASSGVLALQLIEEQAIHLIICDLDMPDMNGLTLCGIVKRNADYEKIPFLLLTGKGSEAQKLVAFEHGVDDFVEKPFRSELLTWRVKSLLKNAERQVKLRTVIVPEPQAVVHETVTERFIQEVVDTIERHIDKDYLNVDFLADELCMSRATFYRKMEEMFNEPPSSFIKKYRLKKAIMYLQSGSYTLKQVSDKSGFSNPRYFSKCFKTEFGVLPSEYNRAERT
ncbi:hybrid sensor histidine kinase/response regulator transcription factor [Parapedobacter deserti]